MVPWRTFTGPHDSLLYLRNYQNTANCEAICFTFI